MWFRVWGSGFRDQGLGFRGKSLRCGVQGSLRVEGVDFRDPGSGLRVCAAAPPRTTKGAQA